MSALLGAVSAERLRCRGRHGLRRPLSPFPRPTGGASLAAPGRTAGGSLPRTGALCSVVLVCQTEAICVQMERIIPAESPQGLEGQDGGGHAGRLPAVRQRGAEEVHDGAAAPVVEPVAVPAG